MRSRQRALIEILADGAFHSGEALAESLGISRSSVWKSLQTLAQTHQLEIHAVRGRGYRLARPIDLLQADSIREGLHPERQSLMVDIEVFDSLASTNRYQAARAEEWRDAGARATLAEQQTHGKGRRGRTWVSPFGANLYLSFYWSFDLPMARLNGLSLAAGVATARALERFGLRDAALKWPNDIHHRDRKLGGILVEVLGQSTGPVSAIVGVGLNVDMPPAAGRDIDQEWTDLARSIPQAGRERNRLAALVVDELMIASTSFAQAGWSAFQRAWAAYDTYRGRAVVLHTSGGTEQGTYMGVDDDGGLILRQGAGQRIFHAGEVSLRKRVPGTE